MIRRDALESTIGELIPGSPWTTDVARLRCLRGIDTLSAVGLCAEVGDFQRFAKAGQLMSYVGLVPSEDTSGETAGKERSPRPGPARPPAAGRGSLALVRREALCCIPGAAGTNSKEGSWV